MKLTELFLDPDLADLDIDHIVTDSREAGPRSLFVALQGQSHDGHDFVAEAAGRGAAAALVKRPVEGVTIPQIIRPDLQSLVGPLCARLYGTDQSDLLYIGITGTDGKTTTSRIVEYLLTAGGHTAAYVGTSGISYPGFSTSHEKLTTPEAAKLHPVFRQMKSAGVGTVVMEVSSHALEQQRVDGVPYKVAVFTNFSRDHIEYHGSREAYFQAKSRLFGQLPASGTAILNADDPWVMKAAELTRARVITFGCSPEADWRCTNYRENLQGLAFDLDAPYGRFSVRTKMHGFFNAMNCLAALAACSAAGAELVAAIENLADFPGAAGRQEQVDAGQDFLVISDFAHTIKGVEAILTWAGNMPHHEIWAVGTCAALRDLEKRPVIGRLLSDLADHPVLTTGLVYQDNPEQILADMDRGLSPGRCRKFLSRFDAMRYCIDHAAAGDIVLILGIGDYPSLPVGELEIPYSETDFLKQCLHERLLRSELEKLASL